jgi:hypothetical protein
VRVAWLLGVGLVVALVLPARAQESARSRTPDPQQVAAQDLYRGVAESARDTVRLERARRTAPFDPLWGIR